MYGELEFHIRYVVKLENLCSASQDADNDIPIAIKLSKIIVIVFALWFSLKYKYLNSCIGSGLKAT